MEICARWYSVRIRRIWMKCFNLCLTASSQRPAQLYIKCVGNAILALLSANFTVEVILRKWFGETWKKFAFLSGDHTRYARNKGCSKRVSREAMLIAQPYRSQVSRNASSYNTLSSYLNPNFWENTAAHQSDSTWHCTNVDAVKAG